MKMEHDNSAAQCFHSTDLGNERPTGNDHLIALRSLLSLANHTAKEETSLQSTHAEFTRSANAEFSRNLKSHEETRDIALRQAEKTRLEHIDAVNEGFEERLQKTRKKFDAEHEKVIEQSSKTIRDTEDALEQAVFLADSVLEGHRQRLSKGSDELIKSVESQLQAIDHLQIENDNLVRRYLPEPPALSNFSSDYKPLTSDRDQEPQVRIDLARNDIDTLEKSTTTRLFSGRRPLALLFIVTAAPIYPLIHFTQLESTIAAALGAVAGLTLATLFALLCAARVKSRIIRNYIPLSEDLHRARRAANKRLKGAQNQWQAAKAPYQKKRDDEIISAREKFKPLLVKARRRLSHSVQRLENAQRLVQEQVEEARDNDLKKIEDHYTTTVDKINAQFNVAESEARIPHEHKLDQHNAEFQSKWDTLKDAWLTQSTSAYQIMDHATAACNQTFHPWSSPVWREWAPPESSTSIVQFGRLQIDLDHTTSPTPEDPSLRQNHPTTFTVPASLSFPNHGSLLIKSPREGRDTAIQILQTVMTRLMTAFEPGRVHFTLIDPVGLGQTFAGFMHLADHEKPLVGKRIWTETHHIEQQLANLTEHMENVIQKYLRNEFDTIDDYNAQAGVLAEPYRFLVIADFPGNFSEEAMRRLASIVSSGARCGVYTLIAMDTRQPLPPGFDAKDFSGHGVTLKYHEDQFRFADPTLSQFPIDLDPAPPEDLLSSTLRKVGREAQNRNRIEVDFHVIAPDVDQIWSRDAAEDVYVPIGRAGATRLQNFSLGKGVAQHALIAGKTGSGKSTLLHVLITNLAMWYSPEDVQFYLVDFKKGVEFKTYATHKLPHARAVAIESDREFGLSVLQRLDAEMQRRGDLFRDLGVQSLAAYRKESNEPLARTLLIIDEFQEFFSDDDKVAQDAMLLLDRLVRQGRAFGIHVLLGSQTLAGTYSLNRSTIGQMAVRVALQSTEADSELILSETNAAARLLSRPGEAIYNDAGGLVEGNSPFQVAWLPDERLDQALSTIADIADQRFGPDRDAPIVFEGNIPANLNANQPLKRLLTSPSFPNDPAAASEAYLGDPVAIKNPTAFTLRRHNGANLLIVGQRDEPALAMLTSSAISLAAQFPKDNAVFHLMDGAPADSTLAAYLPKITNVIPHQTHDIQWRDVESSIANLHTELLRRQTDDLSQAPSHFLIIYGMQRYRMLRQKEDDFSFSMDETDSAPAPEKQFADILRDGPPLGIHTLLWCDTLASVNRIFDRQSLREFETRILFQMSANDSTTLIDTPDASRLGLHRAILHSEELGLTEKFRPYAIPPQHDLDHYQSLLTQKNQSFH